MAMESIYWIVVMGGIVAWIMAYGIGANDVANAFATSVGSHTLKLKWAVVMAAVMETLGAILLGGSVSNTISGGIASPSAFAATPDVFAYGMLCALSAAAIWLLVATYMELPVSTTHTIIGGVMGFALVYGGVNGVVWNKKSDTFPFFSGVSVIVASWVVSPLTAGLLSFCLFHLVRFSVLTRKNSANLAIWVLPVLVFVTIFINLVFVLSKGMSKVVKLPIGTVLWISVVSGVGAALLAGAIGIPLLKRAKKGWDEKLAEFEATGKEIPAEGLPHHRREGAHIAKSSMPDFLLPKTIHPEDNAVKKALKNVYNFLTGGLNTDIFACVDEDSALKHIHDGAIKYDPRTEQVFKYLQVISAAAVSFAHGANDVSNAIGPFAAIYAIYQTGMTSSKNPVEPWMLGGIGATGIVAGLATYGWKIIRVLGVKTTFISPSRGFAMETSTSLVIAFGSYLGLPLSTTQTHVGSTTGVGLAENRIGAVKWSALAKMFCGWVATLIIGGGISAGLFAQGIYSPSLPAAKQSIAYQTGIAADANATLGQLSAALDRKSVV